MFLLSILLAAASCFIIGFLLHGPVLGKLWMKLADIHPTGNEKFSDMYGKMAWNFVANIVSAFALYVITYIITIGNVLFGPNFNGQQGVLCGVIASILVWIVIAAGSSMEVIWMGKKWQLWMFEILSSLLCFVAMGIIIGVMM